jgi:hypothetical protein
LVSSYTLLSGQKLVDRSTTELLCIDYGEMNKAMIAFGKSERIAGEIVPPCVTVLYQKFPGATWENRENNVSRL